MSVETDNLGKLIADASSAIDVDVEAQPRSKRGNKQTFWTGSNILALLLLPLIVFELSRILTVETLSESAIETQLAGILHTAQTSLNTSLRETKTLPQVLPNASLANIVAYKLNGNSYQLSIVSNGIEMTLDSEGKLTSTKL
jgi:hypothetical protein